MEISQRKCVIVSRTQATRQALMTVRHLARRGAASHQNGTRQHPGLLTRAAEGWEPTARRSERSGLRRGAGGGGVSGSPASTSGSPRMAPVKTSSSGSEATTGRRIDAGRHSGRRHELSRDAGAVTRPPRDFVGLLLRELGLSVGSGGRPGHGGGARAGLRHIWYIPLEFERLQLLRRHALRGRGPGRGHQSSVRVVSDRARHVRALGGGPPFLSLTPPRLPRGARQEEGKNLDPIHAEPRRGSPPAPPRPSA